MMFHIPRKKGYSGKAKKQQLKDKRERLRARRELEDLLMEAERTEGACPPTAPQPIVELAAQRGDLRSIFQKESKEAVEARKRDAARALEYAPDRGNSQAIYTYGTQEPDNQPRILTKPNWSREMTSEELNGVDDRALHQWITDLEEETARREDGAQLNTFERNVEVWRQLWRVVERSSVLVHLADARCPLLLISDQLMTHIRAFLHKRVVLVLTKTDLVGPKRVQEWTTYLQARYGQDVPVLAYSRENVDGSNAELMRTIGRVSAGVKHCEPTDGASDVTKRDEKDTLTVGFVGEPNVGKSSLLNSLFDRKLVSVSATPGHTKHLQTHFFDRVEMLERGEDSAVKRLVLCDCPGVVFPRFNVPVLLQILFGSFPIAQTREPYSAVRFIAENCMPPLDEVYKLKPVEEGDDDPWSPYTLCEAYAKLRGFRMMHGKPDASRAANTLLRDTLNGKKVVLSFPPPRLSSNESSASGTAARVLPSRSHSTASTEASF